MRWYQRVAIVRIGKLICIISNLILVCVALVFVVFTLFGYKLVVCENALPDWSGISTVASWVLPTVISTLALFIAVRVPMQIAKSQNRVAIYEKREELFENATSFFGDWRSLSDVEKRKRNRDPAKICEYLISYRQFHKKAEAKKTNNYDETDGFYYIDLLNDLFRRDKTRFEKIRRLFTLSEVQQEYLVQVIKCMDVLRAQIYSVLFTGFGIDGVFQAITNLNELLNNDLTIKFLETMEKQLIISDC